MKTKYTSVVETEIPYFQNERAPTVPQEDAKYVPTNNYLNEKSKHPYFTDRIKN